MNAAQLHLMVNHFPIVGMILAIPVLLLARTTFGGRGAAIAAVLLIVIASLGSTIAVLSGENAYELLQGTQGIQEMMVETHEERAELANVLAIITGLVALGFFFFSLRKNTRSPIWLWSVVMILVLITSIMMGWVALAGGEIRHPELRSNWSNAPSQLMNETLSSMSDRLENLIGSGTATAEEKMSAVRSMLSEVGAESYELHNEIVQAVERAGDRGDELIEKIGDTIKEAHRKGANIPDAVRDAIRAFENRLN